MKKKTIIKVTIVVVFAVFFIAVPVTQFLFMRAMAFPYSALYQDGNHSIMGNFSPNLTLYKTNTIDVSFDYAEPRNWTEISSFSYSLNESSNDKLAFSKWSDDKYHVYYAFGTLRDLPNANYDLIIYANYDNGTSKQINIHELIIDTNFVQPTLRVISPINQTYPKNSLDLIYNINSKVLWSYYALDIASFGDTQNWVPFSGNITLTNLSEGSHKLLVEVQTEGNKFSQQIQQIIYFNIDTTYQP
jgi:hypothetical protein